MTELTPALTESLFPEAQEVCTPAEQEALQARLWPLWEKQFARKTQGDHSSLRVETAQELMESILFTLRFYLQAQGLSVRLLLTQPIEPLFAAAQQALLQTVADTQELYLRACATVQTFQSRTLAESLRGIAPFFRLYDARLAAQSIPADIDYPLCEPIPDTPAGVCYIRSYLNRLCLENALLTRFLPDRVLRLLTRSCPDYRNAPINLYEPVAACVTGLALLGGGETLLEITPAQGERLAAHLRGQSPTQARRLLSDAAQAACLRLGLTDGPSVQSMQHAAVALYPRLSASPGSERGVFSIR